MDNNCKHKRLTFEAHLIRLSLISSVPLLLFLLWMMIYADISIWLILLIVFLGGTLVIYANLRIHQKLEYQFRTLRNLLDAMTQGDYSLRSRSDQSSGELGELITSINGFAERLSAQRLDSVESQHLVRTIINHIDVAIVALNEENQISFLNPAAKKLLMLDQTDSDSNTRLLEQLAFVQSFTSGCHQVVELTFGHQQGRFNICVEEFRESGLQNKLLFITDVRTLLRSEERKAWQSLVRVISHEINNSLSPIASISQTLNRLISRQSDRTENSKDLIEGLTIITERANGLSEFVDSYKQLAKLPEPQKQMVSILRLFEKICILFKDQSIIIESEDDIELRIDPVQFEQVLINLIKNSIEAMLQTNPDGVIRVEWIATEFFFKLVISDQGGGLNNSDNLFVPFYSTKKQGSGIGLIFCRQIIEAHNGSLSIANRLNSQGCCATIEIPLSAAVV
ncbi:MAG: PAS domain-containing sensor histidine kinase [Thiohalomonadales bacterium]